MPAPKQYRLQAGWYKNPAGDNWEAAVGREALSWDGGRAFTVLVFPHVDDKLEVAVLSNCLVSVQCLYLWHCMYLWK